MNHQDMKAIPLGYEDENLRGVASTKIEVNHLTKTNCIFKPTHLKATEDLAGEEYGELEAVEERRKKE